MHRIMQFLKVPIALYSLTLFSCKTNNSIDTNNVFERAFKSDSLSYYFPPILNDTFERENPFYKDFKQRWYSSSLYSFKEPILYTKTDSEIIYRLLWLRSFHEPVCFTIKGNKGNYFLNAKTLDRQPAFNPTIEGKYTNTNEIIFDTIQKADRYALITFDTIKVLTSRQWKAIENYLTKLNFWNGPIDDPNSQGGTDGANWIIEGRKDKEYHFVDRRNDNGELIPLGKYLIKLSGINIEDDSIY